MCGICGFTGEGDDAVLRRMAAALVHRGPDEDGFYADEQIHLGMRRLSIVDVETGHQPVHNEDETLWTVFNGEIYDAPERRRELEARHRFYTHHSDTELIVHLYEQYGDDWPARINGMFGIALWDAAAGRLLLYRDRMGQKPLYYSLHDGQILFASEIKALFAHPAVSGELDYAALYEYFALKSISAPATAYADIRQLPPGCVLSWHRGRHRVRPFWSLDFARSEDLDEDAAAGRLLELLDDAVRIRMRCDVPYGAYLSGGVDSSSVVSMMSRWQDRPVVTFALGYEDEPAGQFAGKQQDLYWSREMARRLGTDHHERILSAGRFYDDMPAVMRAFDEPFSGTVSTYFLSGLIAEHVKVTLSGDGADELFGSYLAHRLAFPIERYLALAAAGKRDLDDLDAADRLALRPFDTPQQFAFLQALADPRQAVWRDKLAVFGRAQRQRLLSPEFLDRCGAAPQENFYAGVESKLTAGDALNRVLELDQRELLANQVLPFVDRLSMAHSVEVRCPYLDVRMVELANALPGRLKIRDGVNKYIHKRAMVRLLPDDLLNRPKEGFVQPIYSWMHGALKDRVLADVDALPDEWFNAAYVAELRQRFCAGDASVNAKIWNLACLSIWRREVYGP